MLKNLDEIVSTPGLDGVYIGPADLTLGLTGRKYPTGFDRDHPLAEDLKRKDFAAYTKLSEAEAIAPGFLDTYVRACEEAAPLMRFLCGALSVAY